MYRVAIVEDEAVYAQQLEAFLRQYEQERGAAFQISAFADGFAIVRDYRPVWTLFSWTSACSPWMAWRPPAGSESGTAKCF